MAGQYRWSVLHEPRKCILLGRMPPRQRRTVLDQVAGRLGDTLRILFGHGLIVRAQDVDITCRDPLEQQRRDPLRRPYCVGFGAKCWVAPPAVMPV